jgi:hypothetical protein
MRTLIPLLVLFSVLAGCNNPETRVRPFVEMEHRYSHTLETRMGANINGPKHDIDLYWAPIIGISDHLDTKVRIDYPLAFGMRWRLK